MKVKDIMNKAIVVDFDMPLKAAAKIMSQKNIGSLIVIKNKEIAGIITEKDITKNASTLGKKISSVMSKNVVTIEEYEDIDNAAVLMMKNKVKHLPVTKDEKLIGIISATDLIEHSEELNEDFLID